jgi:hypothetical protein
MQNIETLFSRELGIDEARAVYPEYGFTENMTDVITTSAYATVASLLLFGAERGACAVAGGVRVAPIVEPEVKPQRHTIRVTTPMPEPQPEPEPQPKPDVVVKPEPQPAPESQPETDIFDPGDNAGKKKGGKRRGGFLSGLDKWMTNIGNQFVGNNDESEF